MTHNPYAVEPREPLTPKQKLQMFIKADGICCICGCKINGVKEAWDEHVNPLWLNGDNSAPNRAPAHEKCARAKTSGEAEVRSKLRNTAEKHFGAKKKAKGRPMPGTKASGMKHRMDGSWEKR